MGNGRYIPIPQDGGQLVIIETPFDIEIIELQGRINGTVIPYGPKMQRSSVEQKTRQVATAPVPTASEMAGYMARNAKRSGGTDAITGEGDLVADVTSGRQKLGSVKDDDLPDNMRGLNADARQAMIDKQMAERKALNEKMAALVKKRDTYVAEKRAAQPKVADSFDRAVEETLKVQTKR